MTLEQLKQVFPTEEAYPDPKFTVYGSGLVEVQYSHILFKVEEIIEKIHQADYNLESISSRNNELVIQVVDKEVTS